MLIGSRSRRFAALGINLRSTRRRQLSLNRYYNSRITSQKESKTFDLSQGFYTELLCSFWLMSCRLFWRKTLAFDEESVNRSIGYVYKKTRRYNWKKYPPTWVGGLGFRNSTSENRIIPDSQNNRRKRSLQETRLRWMTSNH
jgi:hypothetical protein